MHTFEASNHGPRSGSGPQLQPRFDSLGRKVPIWDAVEIETRQNVEKQASWKSWMSRTSSTSTLKESIPYGTGSQRQPSSWTSWIPFASRGKPRPISKDLYPSSPYVSLPSNSFDQPTSWKPTTLRLPVLGSIFVFTLGMIAVLEVLSYLSTGKNNEMGGGLAFAATADELPLTAIAAFIYLPTVVAVIYSIVWSWVDLDVKRLEPWFQLSKPEGATAENSVLLSYPFDFLAFVPIRATRRRHWAVVIAGSTMMLITWAIVPLQSAIFSIGTVQRSTTSTMALTKTFMPLEEQLSHLNSRFMVTAYGVSWLDQQLPAYTTKNYALLPFAPVDLAPAILSSETWTSPTSMLYTNLTCAPVSFNRSSNPNTTQPWQYVSDGKGCVQKASNILDFIVTSNWLSYTPWCNSSFLAVWAQSDPNQVYDVSSMEWDNITAIACQPSYHARKVTATVNATTLAVISVDTNEISEPVQLNEERIVFNTSLFEELANNGGLVYKSPKSPTASRPDLRFGNPLSIAQVEQVQKLTMFNITPASDSKEFSERSFVPYALAASTVGFDGLSDSAQLGASFERAHRVLFAAAASDLLVNINKTGLAPINSVVEGSRRDEPEAILYVRTFAVVVEACLGLAALLTCALWIYYRKRPSLLRSDPRAIVDVMELVRSSQQLFKGFHDYGATTLTSKDLEDSLKGGHFRLHTDRINGMQLRVIGGGSFEVNSKSAAAQSQARVEGTEQFEAVRPLELKYITGIALGLAIAAAMALLSFLYVSTIQHNGLTQPSGNKVVLLILTSLVPTAFATFIEPFWVILNRLRCILQPFEDLRDGGAKSAATIKARYTALPPQLPIIDAIKSKHYLLALVCIVSLSTNVLAVALSGLFNQESAVVSRRSSTTTTLTPKFNDPGGTRYSFENDFTKWQSLDQFYVASAFLENTALLVPWVDEQYFYLPFDLPEIATQINDEKDLGVQAYTAQTRGYGLSVNCEPILEDAEDEFVVFKTTQNGTRNQLNVVRKLESGGNMTCSTLMTSDDIYVFPVDSAWSDNATAIEWVYSMYNHLDPENMATHEYCGGMVLAGYVRVDGAPAKAALQANQTLKGHVESTFMTCKPTIRTGLFDIKVDTAGRIQSSVLSGSLSTDIEEFGHNMTELRLRQTAAQVVAPMRSPAIATWHNDSFQHDWMNTLLGIKLNTSDLVNPAKALPNITDLAPHFAEMYELIFPITLSLAAGSMLNSSTPRTLPIDVVSKEQRIFMEPTLFYISISLLALQLFTAILYYTMRPRRFLPRLPLSIASIISYVSSAHAVQDVKGLKDTDGSARYGYGHYIGVDGKSHVGIEKAELVVPLKSSNPEVKRRTWWRIKADELEPRTWI